MFNKGRVLYALAVKRSSKSMNQAEWPLATRMTKRSKQHICIGHKTAQFQVLTAVSLLTLLHPCAYRCVNNYPFHDCYYIPPEVSLKKFYLQ